MRRRGPALRGRTMTRRAALDERIAYERKQVALNAEVALRCTQALLLGDLPEAKMKSLRARAEQLQVEIQRQRDAGVTYTEQEVGETYLAHVERDYGPEERRRIERALTVDATE